MLYNIVKGVYNMRKGVILMAFIYVLITAVLFTTYEPVSKLLAADINPYAITAIRFLIGALILLPFSIREIKQKNVKLQGKDFLIMGGLGTVFICGSMVLLQIAVKMAESPALIAIVFSSNSIITIVLSAIFLRAKMTWVKWSGVALCIVGVLISADFSSGSNLTSVALALVSALIFSAYTVVSKQYMKRVSGIIQNGFSFLLGSIVLGIVLLFLKVDIVSGVSMDNLPVLLYIGIAVSGIAYWTYFNAIKLGGAQTAALTFFIKPILTPFATFFINGITPKGNILIAVVFVVADAVLASGTLSSLKRSKE